MKKASIIYSFLFISLFVFFSCEKEDLLTTGDVIITVTFDSGHKFMTGADIYLYYSKDSMAQNKYALTYKSTTDQNSSCILYDLEPGTYYIKGRGTYNNDIYYNTDILHVKKGTMNQYNFNLYKTRNLEVLVFQENKGAIGGADVFLYLKFEDYLKKLIYQSQVTSLTEPMKGFALFKNLEPQLYFIEVLYTNSEGSFHGFDSIKVGQFNDISQMVHTKK